MRILIDIPDEQIKKSLEESKYIHEDEGEKGFVNIAMLYTNSRLDFVAVERKTNFYSCKYKILTAKHGQLLSKSEDEYFKYRLPKLPFSSCQTLKDVREILDILDKHSDEGEAQNANSN